jgi:hypothetical protein
MRAIISGMFRFRHFLRWTDVVFLGNPILLVKRGFVSVDTKAGKPSAGTHLDRWVHPFRWERNFCFALRLAWSGQ